MAGINHTVIPNLSIDSLDGSSASVPSLTVASTASLVVAGKAAFTGTESHTGTETHSGAVTFSGAITLGTAGSAFAALRKSSTTVALGTAAGDSVTTSVTIPNIAAGDPIIAVVPASTWSGAYRDIVLTAYASTASTVVLGAVNSTITAINTDAMLMDFHWLDLA